MFTFYPSVAALRMPWVLAFLLSGGLGVVNGQGVQTVQQAQFRSQWVGEQVDQIAPPPLNGLGAIVGSLQTQDQVDREVAASFANLKEQSPFSFKPVLSLGWQFSNQGGQSKGSNSTSSSSSSFVAPSLAILYDRDHGPWTTSVGYSVGFTYYPNANFNGGGGTTSQRNPISQSIFGNASLQMSRYTFNATASASSGTGYDFSSGSNNRQITSAGSASLHYILTSYTSVDSSAGVSLQNASQSTNTPNNNTGSLFANLTPTYELSDKTHLSAVFGAGSSFQSLQQGTAAPGNTPATNNAANNLSYAQVLAQVRYDLTGKSSFNASLGARDVIGSGNNTSSSYTGIKPSWTLGLNYTPTPKTSLNLHLGEQGSDVVPEWGLSLNWMPRQKTQVSLSFYQTESYSSTLNSSYQVSTGVLGSLSQQLFTSVSLSLSAGYTQQRFINLSNTQSSSSSLVNGQTSSQLPSTLYLVQASLNWRIRDGISLANSLSANSGQNQNGGGSSGSQPTIWYSISLNFSL